MVDVAKHIRHWLTGAKEAWDDAELLLAHKRYAFGAFSAHLSLEKALKAHITRATGGVPPRTHDLSQLAGLTGLHFSEVQLNLLDVFNGYQLEGRYPEVDAAAIDPELLMKDVHEMKEMLAWLMKQF